MIGPRKRDTDLRNGPKGSHIPETPFFKRNIRWPSKWKPEEAGFILAEGEAVVPSPWPRPSYNVCERYSLTPQGNHRIYARRAAKRAQAAYLVWI